MLVEKGYKPVMITEGDCLNHSQEASYCLVPIVTLQEAICVLEVML